jgi:hypothetical protein
MYPDIFVQLIWSHLTRTKCIIPFWLLLLGVHTCTRDLTILDKILMYHSILSYARRQTYLYNWSITLCRKFMNFWPMLLASNICISDFNTLYSNLMYQSILLLGTHTCTSIFITHGRNLMNHSILNKAPRQVIRSQLAGT